MGEKQKVYQKLKNIYNNVIYTLIIILSVSIYYLTFRTALAAKVYSSESKFKMTPENSKNYIETFWLNKPIEVTYTTSENTVSLNGISNAQLIYEYLNESGQSCYKAQFEDNVPTKTIPIVSVDSLSANQLPRLSFIDALRVPNSSSKAASSIFIKLTHNLISNFTYEHGYYYHYRDIYKDIDRVTQRPIYVSNVIVQFVKPHVKISSPYETGKGRGLLFYGGRVIDIRWDKEKGKPIEILDEKGRPVSLLRGKIWWIILNENSSVAYK